MEEPHIPTATDASQGYKRDVKEEPDKETSQQQLSKPMEVDEFPTTSAGGETINESLFESNTSDDNQLMAGTKKAGSAEDETIPEEDETIEEVNFDKPTEALDENITLDYAEKSINISQIIMEHQDDSTDAFDALKRDETDVLNEIKVEINEKPESELTPMETLELSSPIAVDGEEPHQSDDIIVEEPSVEETTQKSIENQKQSSELETSQSQTEIEIIGEELDKEDLCEKIDEDVESIQSPAAAESCEKAEEEETETTNEGKRN